MLQQHPITPSIELVKQWSDRWHSAKDNDFDVVLFVAIEAARWGADQELEACCEWLKGHWIDEDLRKHRRPKPPSLKEQAKFAAAVLRSPDETCSIAELQQHWHTICNALESLPD